MVIILIRLFLTGRTVVVKVSYKISKFKIFIKVREDKEFQSIRVLSPPKEAPGKVRG